MEKKLLLAVLAAGLAGGWCGNALLFADEGEEVIQAHQVEVYPGGVEINAGDRGGLLVKDEIATVKKYYESHQQAGDRLVPFKDENEQGFRLMYFRTIAGREQSVQLVEIAAELPKTILHPALGELKAQVRLGHHTDAEYQALEKKYKRLGAAYFLLVEDETQGRRVPQGDAIYRQAAKQAHGDKPAEMDADEKAQGKARAKEIQKEMKALKAKGDIAGMMRLAQEKRNVMKMPKAGEAAMAEMGKDTWDIWVKCLQDLQAAAYWTKLQFNDNALPRP